jgi:hypothetical protein
MILADYGFRWQVQSWLVPAFAGSIDKQSMELSGMTQNDHANSIKAIFTTILFLFVIRALFMMAGMVVTGEYYSIFAPFNDVFADSIKSGLAQLSVSAPLLDDARPHSWPALFQNYLYHNDYLKPGMSVYHSPPLSMLALMGVAALLLVFSPMVVIALLIALYSAGTLAVSKAIETLGKLQGTRIFPLILLAFPSLFMLDRGNIHSGMTSLAIIFYVTSAFFRRWKWGGWLALALAVNLRPNVAIFAFMELYRTENRWEAFKGMVAAGLLSIAIAVVSLWLAHRIDPAYSLDAFTKAYGLYTRNYVEGFDGVQWNASLFNVGKIWQMALDHADYYSPAWSMTATVLGAASLAICILLASLRRMSGTRFAFAMAANCTLFTPVLGEYHVLIFIAPLLLLILNARRELTPAFLWCGAAWIVVLQTACMVQWLLPNMATLILAGLCALALPFLARRTLRCADQVEGLDMVLMIASIAMLSPIGGEMTHGSVNALILCSAMGLLIWTAARRGVLITNH